MSATNSPTTRQLFTSVWTGTEMIVWGGLDTTNLEDSNWTNPAGGGKFDPAQDTWTSMTITGEPTGRHGHIAVWTGSKMIIWGGFNWSSNTYLNDGAVYDPATDTWAAISDTNAPAARNQASYIWANNRLYVWGGGNSDTYLNTGGVYDPTTNTWSTLPNAPFTGRVYNSLIWADSKLIVVGGQTVSGSADVPWALSP
jgi:N-acetylneuraminic acid mutarotase